MLVIHVSVQILPANCPIILNCKFSVGNLHLERRVDFCVKYSVPPVIQREPNEDNVTVIQHHHIALTCTANGGRIDRKMSTFIFEDYFQEIHGLQYHGKKMVYPSTELVHDTGKS